MSAILFWLTRAETQFGVTQGKTWGFIVSCKCFSGGMGWTAGMVRSRGIKSAVSILLCFEFWFPSCQFHS